MENASARALVALVDDDPDFRKVTEDWLGTRYDVEGYAAAEELLEALPESKPDLVILDVRLPGLDGFEACRALRRDERFSRTPVLFLTGSSDDSDFVKNLEAGGTAYVTKPVKRAELLEKIAELVEG